MVRAFSLGLEALAMPYEVYKVLHLAGVFMVVMSTAGLAMHVANGGTKDHAFHKPAMRFHGFGLVLVFVAGFGLMARIGIMGFPWPLFVFLKIGIWLTFGGLGAMVYRKPEMASKFWWIVWLLAATAAWVAVYKPGNG
jgi:hypothetical protein